MHMPKGLRRAILVIWVMMIGIAALGCYLLFVWIEGGAI
jgi:hypothetical protein